MTEGGDHQSEMAKAIEENSQQHHLVLAEVVAQDRRYKEIMHQKRMDALREHGDRVRFETIGDKSIGK